MSSTIPRTRPLWLRSRPRLQLRQPRPLTRSISAPIYPVRSHNTEEGLKIRAIPVRSETPIIDSSPKPMDLRIPIITDSYPVGVVGIRLNRPSSLNAINHDLLDSLYHQISNAVKDRSTRVIVIMGEGDNFCAGQDLKESMTKSGPNSISYETELREALEKLQRITYLLSKSDAFVIAAVAGHAVGGGAELALAADYIVGGQDTKFSFPEVQIGYMATGGVTARLTKMVGLMRAKEILLTGREIGGDEAMDLGLISEIIANGGSSDVKGRAVELAKTISRMPSTSISRTKRCVEAAADGMKFDDLLQMEVSGAIECSRQEAAKKVFYKFGNGKASTSSYIHFNPHAATPLSGGALGGRTANWGDDPNSTTIRYTNRRNTRPYSSLSLPGWKWSKMLDLSRLMEDDMSPQERTDYARWVWEQYESKILQDLDRVYSCFGLTSSSFHSLNELMKVELKMNFLAHSNNRRGDAFIPQLTKLRDTVKAMKTKHFELGQEFLKLRGEMGYLPDGVDQRTLEKLDLFTQAWDSTWKRRLEYQNKARADGMKLMCWGYDKFATYGEVIEYTPDMWRKAIGKKKKKEKKSVDG